MARIIGVALSPSKKFLGFVDSKGKIRKGKVKRVKNPSSSEFNIFYKDKFGQSHRLHGFYSDGKWIAYVDSMQYTFGDRQPKTKAAALKRMKHYVDWKFR